MPDIIIASQLDTAVNLRLAQQAQVRVIDLPPGDLSGLSREANVLFARPFNKVGSAAATRAAPIPQGWPLRLDWVQLASVGIDFYPAWLLQGPIVTLARGTASDAIAEYVLAAIFSAAKRVPEIWLKDAAPWQRPVLSLVQGSVLGLYGFGSIGRALAQRALALGMRVLALRRSEAPFDIDGVEAAANLSELAARADHLVLAAPATSATRRAVNREVLAQAKPGLHLINIARGSLIDDQALLDALASGRVGLATLDVTDPEPLPAGHGFYGHPRVSLSPHIAPNTEQLADALLDKFLSNLQRFRSGQPLTDVLDPARGY